MIWKPLNKSEFSYFNDLSNEIHKMEKEDSNLLTNTRTGVELIIASDYAGGLQGSKYNVFSFLFADSQHCKSWNDKRKKLRKSKFKDKRRMCFKAIDNDSIRKKALPYFLTLADLIPGNLFTLLVDRKIDLIKPSDDPFYEKYSLLWNPKVFEKLLKIAHFSAMFISGLLAKHQQVRWITDEDDIIANEDKLNNARELLYQLLSAYIPEKHTLKFIGTSEDDEEMTYEDLTAIPDLVAGALNEFSNSPSSHATNIYLPIDKKTKRKTKTILTWLQRREVADLKKIIIKLDKGKQSEISTGSIDFSSEILI